MSTTGLLAGRIHSGVEMGIDFDEMSKCELKLTPLPSNRQNLPVSAITLTFNDQPAHSSVEDNDAAGWVC